MKNVKNRPKTRNPPKTKKIPWLNYDFLGIFKVKKKHVILTYKTIWHKKTTVLMVGFLTNGHFL